MAPLWKKNWGHAGAENLVPEAPKKPVGVVRKTNE